MIEAYKKFWKGYVDFEGRSTRSDYWFAYLANMLTVVAFYVLLAVFGGIAGATDSSFLAVISLILLLIFFAYGIAACLPGIAVLFVVCVMLATIGRIFCCIYPICRLDYPNCFAM